VWPLAPTLESAAQLCSSNHPRSAAEWHSYPANVGTLEPTGPRVLRTRLTAFGFAALHGDARLASLTGDS
jgi:hypothetical protein